MKNLGLLISTLVLISSQTTFASNKVDINVETDTEAKAKILDGFKIAIGGSSMNHKIKGELPKGAKDSDSISGGRKISLGYSDVVIGDFSYAVELSFLDTLPSSHVDADYSALDNNVTTAVNVTYGINEKFYAFGGLNLSSFGDTTYTEVTNGNTTVDIEADSTSGIGYQVGIGAKFTKYLGFELSYVDLNSSLRVSHSDERGTFSTKSFDINTNGTQFQLTANF